MLYVKFDDLGNQQDISDDLRYIDNSWVECPKDFDPSIQKLRLLEGEISTGELPPYVEPPHYRIYDYMNGDYDRYQFPGDILFDILGLYNKSFVAMGLRVKSIHYSDLEMTDAIVKVEYIFTQDENKSSMKSCLMTISWRMSDGSWSARTKTIPKRYNNSLEKQKELEARRNNIIDQLKGLADQMGLLPQMNQLFYDYGPECFQYLKSGSPSLKNVIQNDTKTSWLNANLPNGKPARNAILTYLSVGLG